MTMANKLTDEKREQMFQAYCERQSIQFIAGKCTVNRTTVKRYRDLDNWENRRAAIARKSQKKSDDAAAKRRARWAKQGQVLQQVGTKKFIGKDGQIDESVVKELTPSDGIRAIAEGVKIEREALGDESGGVTITVKLPKDLEGME